MMSPPNDNHPKNKKANNNGNKNYNNKQGEGTNNKLSTEQNNSLVFQTEQVAHYLYGTLYELINWYINLSYLFIIILNILVITGIYPILVYRHLSSSDCNRTH